MPSCHKALDEGICCDCMTHGHHRHLLGCRHLAGGNIELDAALGNGMVPSSRWQSAQVNVPVVQAHSFPQTSVPSSTFRCDWGG